MIYAQPGSEGSAITFKARYENYINGEWMPPVKGVYFTNATPVTGEGFCEIPRSTSEDIDLALDAAHAAKITWGKTSVTERSNLLLKIADRIEKNTEMLAVAETWDNGKAIRENLAADIPLCVDHFRYYAGCIRLQEGTMGELDENTVSYQFHEPLGVVGQIIPWNFPLLMAAWKLAPALVTGNCVVLKPAEQTPVSILILMEIIGDLLPPGVLNVVNGYGKEAGNALATSKRIDKIAFTGSTPVGSHILKCAAENIIPSTVELGGKSPNIFFEDIMQQDDDYISKCAEGAVLAFFNQGEVCTCPSRALIQESIYDEFIAIIIERSKNPGPIILLTAGIHGDEINGIEVIRQIIAKKINKPKKGTVICIPVVNIFGFLNLTREFPDGRDLNRMFPGSQNGALASRFAYQFVQEILPVADLCLDFHTGGASRFNS